MIVVVSGVAGSGKSTVGAALAERLGWDFVEGDAFHPEENVARMREGEPLTDAHRGPWLDSLRAEITTRLREHRPAVVAASALKARHRARLLPDDPRVLLVFLETSPALAARRLRARAGHFFGPALVESQFAALEPPADALVLPADAAVDDLVTAIRRRLPGRSS